MLKLITETLKPIMGKTCATEISIAAQVYWK